MSCGVGRRRGSDPALLWLWRRPAAIAPIRPLAWEPPYATGSGPRNGKKKKKRKRKRKTTLENGFHYRDPLAAAEEHSTFLFSFSFYIIGAETVYCQVSGNVMAWSEPSPLCESKYLLLEYRAAGLQLSSSELLYALKLTPVSCLYMGYVC